MSVSSSMALGDGTAQVSGFDSFSGHAVPGQVTRAKLDQETRLFDLRQ
jgi:hypothetical protein